MQIFPLSQQKRVQAKEKSKRALYADDQKNAPLKIDSKEKLISELEQGFLNDRLIAEMAADSEDARTGEEDEANEDFDGEDDYVKDQEESTFQGTKFYTPPIAYLPLPRPAPDQNVFSAGSVSSKRSKSSTSAIHKRQKLAPSKHLLMDKITARLPTDLTALDNYRYRCQELYSALPYSHTGAPILSRLRRRLLRLAAHAIFAHHRGRHEVLFQTSFLFDLVILEFAKWTAGASGGKKSGHVQLSVFLREAASRQIHKTNPPPVTSEGDALSRMTTTATCAENSVINGDRLDVNEHMQGSIGSVSKEELRTVMMACLLVASKWNNSRYLPPDVLCSNPVGRVPLATLLEFEIAILSLFEFDIPFQTSAMNHLHLLLGTCDEHANTSSYRKLVCHTCLMILEMALCDSESLKYATNDLVRSASWLGVALASSVSSASDEAIPSLDELQSGSDQWWDVLNFQMGNVEFEMKSAMAALPRLEEMNRWVHPMEAPNVFGIDIARRHMLPQCPNFMPTSGDIADAKTKTESLALAYLNSDSCSSAFDLLASAALTDGHRLQYRVHSQNFEHRCEVAERSLALRKARQKWTRIRAEVNKHRASAK